MAIHTAVLAAVGILSLSGCSSAWHGFSAVKGEERPRIIVTCDPELDDSNSMIRFLLHATDYDIAGLIYTSSQVHWAGDGVRQMYRPGREYTHVNGKDLGPQKFWRWKTSEEGPERFINDIIDAYEKCYSNLIVHDRRYPSPEYLRSVTMDGNIYFDGDYSYDSPGSELIVKDVLDDVPGQLYVTAWGGCSTIARALFVIEQRYKGTPEWDSVYKKVSGKLVLLLSGDQDQTYFSYIKIAWPDVIQHAAHGGPSMGYGASRSTPEAYRYMMEPAWMKENISDKGPLGAYYRVWGDGRRMCKEDWFDYFGYSSDNETAEDLTAKGYDVWMPLFPKGTWLGEGDTGTYLDFIDNGLRAWKNDTWCGWSGRRKPGTQADNSSIFGGGTSIPPDLCATYSGIELTRAINAASADREAQMEIHRKAMAVLSQSLSSGATSDTAGAPKTGVFAGGIGRHSDEVIPKNYIEAIQNEISSRLSWSITPKYKDANHHPVIKAVDDIRAKAGQVVSLKAKITDPDGNNLNIKWYVLKVGSYAGDVGIETIPAAMYSSRSDTGYSAGSAKSAKVIIPADAKSGDTIHIIVEVQDDGTPALTRYHRFVITIA